MCGRFLFDGDFDDVYNKLKIYERDFVIHKNEFRPSDQVPVILRQIDHNVLQNMKWGLKGYSQNQMIINARSETLLQKPRYSKITGNRCIIPATLFYEPELRGKQKVMHRFGTGKILYLAGLYEPDLPQGAVTIITMDASGDVKEIHPRMPVAISEESLSSWLQEDKELAYKTLWHQRPIYKRMDAETQISFF